MRSSSPLSVCTKLNNPSTAVRRSPSLYTREALREGTKAIPYGVNLGAYLSSTARQAPSVSLTADSSLPEGAFGGSKPPPYGTPCAGAEFKSRQKERRPCAVFSFWWMEALDSPNFAPMVQNYGNCANRHLLAAHKLPLRRCGVQSPLSICTNVSSGRSRAPPPTMPI